MSITYGSKCKGGGFTVVYDPSSGGSEYTEEIDALNEPVDGSTPSSADEPTALSTLETNIFAARNSAASNGNNLVGSAFKVGNISGSLALADLGALEIIGILENIQEVTLGTKNEVDSALEGVTITDSDLAQVNESISSSLNTIFGGLGDPDPVNTSQISTYLDAGSDEILQGFVNFRKYATSGSLQSANAAASNSGSFALVGDAPTSGTAPQTYVSNGTSWNPVVVSGGGESAVELTDWTTRLSGGPYSEGDYAVWTSTGAVYRFSEALRSGSGDWVRSEAYRSDFSTGPYIEGDEGNDAELLTHGFEPIVTGNGTTIYTGDKVRLVGSGSAARDFTFLRNVPDITSSDDVYVQGLYTASGFNVQYNLRLLFLTDGDNRIWFTLDNANGHMAYTNNGATEIGTQFGQDTEGQFSSTSDEKHLAFSIKNNCVRMWINHAQVPFAVSERDASAFSSTTAINIGADDKTASPAGNGCTLDLRDLSCAIT